MTILVAGLAILAGLALVGIAVIVGVAAHREHLRRLNSPQLRARQAEARLQAHTAQTMRQMLDIARQAGDQQPRH